LISFIDAVSKTDNAEVVVIYSRSEDTAQAFAAKHNLKKWHTDRDAFSE